MRAVPAQVVPDFLRSARRSTEPPPLITMSCTVLPSHAPLASSGSADCTNRIPAPVPTANDPTEQAGVALWGTGQVIVGGVVSCTVTVAAQPATWRPLAGLTQPLAVTVVWPGR